MIWKVQSTIRGTQDFLTFKKLDYFWGFIVGTHFWPMNFSMFIWNTPHFFQERGLSCACVCAQLCPTPCDPMDHSPPGSSVHGISQARILEWVARLPFSSPGDPDSGIDLTCPVSPHWRAGSLPLALARLMQAQAEKNFLEETLPVGCVLVVCICPTGWEQASPEWREKKALAGKLGQTKGSCWVAPPLKSCPAGR